MNKKVIIVVLLIAVAGIIAGYIVTHRKLVSADNADVIQEEQLENYNVDSSKEEIKDVVISDRTEKYPTDSLESLKEPVTAFVEQSLADIMTYESPDGYSEKISGYFADANRFPMMNGDYVNQLIDYLSRHSFNMQYQSVTLSLIRVVEYEDEGTVITIRGYVTAAVGSDIAEKKDYDTTFLMDIFSENDTYKILSLELSKAFDHGIKTYWGDEAHTLVQYYGEFAFDWDVTDEVIFNIEDDFKDID